MVDFKHPVVLKKELNLELKDGPDSLQRLLELCQSTMDHQVKTGTCNKYSLRFGAHLKIYPQIEGQKTLNR